MCSRLGLGLSLFACISCSGSGETEASPQGDADVGNPEAGAGGSGDKTDAGNPDAGMAGSAAGQGGNAGESQGRAGDSGAGASSGNTGGSGQVCDPPNTVEIDGECVPSCGAVGGNQCVEATSTLCEGLPTLKSHDCEVCCHRPAYPAPSPASFHFVYQTSLPCWDSILAMTQQHESVVLVSKIQPPQVGPDRWAAYPSYRDSSPPTAASINALLIDPKTAPRFVMLEELHNAESETFFVALANEMRTKYPQWEGRWGVFLTYGNYPLLSKGIDAFLQAHAVIALELYPRIKDYCSSGSNGGQRDIWMAEQFIGNASLGRLNWLMARRSNQGSKSFITPVFGVGDTLAGSQNAAIFIDRMFYVWVTRSGYPSMLSSANGGPGAYKWQDVEETPNGYGVSSTNRDLAFSESFAHYSVNGQTSSRLGPVTCP